MTALGDDTSAFRDGERQRRHTNCHRTTVCLIWQIFFAMKEEEGESERERKRDATLTKRDARLLGLSAKELNVAMVRGSEKD